MSFWQNYEKRMNAILQTQRVKEEEEPSSKRIKEEVEVEEDMEVDETEIQPTPDIILDPNQKLVDWTVNEFCESLQRRVFENLGYNVKKRGEQEISDPKLDIFFSSFLYTRFVQLGLEGIENYKYPLYQKVDICNARTLFFPVNLSNLHWICLAWREGVLTVYDSFNSLEYDEVANALCTILENWGVQVLETKYHFFNHPQTDSVSCGVYVCFRAMCVVNDRLDEELLEPAKFRNIIIDTIFS